MTNPQPDSSGSSAGLLFRLAAAALLIAAGVMFIAAAAAQSATITFTSGSWTPEKVTLTFSAPIQATPLPNASVFAVYEYTATGVWSDAPVPIASVAVSGSTVTLTLQTSLPAGSRARVFPCGDVGTCNGNALMSTNGATWSATGELTLTPPAAAFSHANVNGYISEIYFDRDITTTQLPAASAFTISGHAAQIFDVYWSSDHVGLRIAPPVPNGVQPDITYAKPATNPLTSPGGDIAAFNIKSSSGNSFIDPGPVVTNIARNGNALVLTADAALAAPASAAASHFKACTSWSATAGAASGCTDATGYAIASRNVTLSFPAGTIQDGVKLWLLYQAVPNASASLHDASDSDRKLGLIDPHPFTISSALPTLSTASVDGATVTLTFSGNLKTASALTTAAFTFTPSQVVSSAVASGKMVTIMLGTALAEGASLSVSYSQPAAPAAALEAADGRKIANFTSTVANNTDTAPAVSGISVNGAALVITFDQNLKASPAPAASAFSVSVNGSARTVSAVAISARTVTLTLASPVDPFRCRHRGLYGTGVESSCRRNWQQRSHVRSTLGGEQYTRPDSRAVVSFRKPNGAGDHIQRRTEGEHIARRIRILVHARELGLRRERVGQHRQRHARNGGRRRRVAVGFLRTAEHGRSRHPVGGRQGDSSIQFIRLESHR